MHTSRLKIVSAALAAAAAILSTGSTSAGAGFDGSVVNVSAYFPNTNSLFESGGNTTVSGAVEYPAGTFLMYDRFAQIDITDGQIIIKNTLNMDAPFNLAAFNGFVLTITSGPAIASAEVDPESQCSPAGISIVDGNELFLNFEGVTQGAGTSAIIDLSPVPEPSTTTLVAFGLPILLAFCRRKA